MMKYFGCIKSIASLGGLALIIAGVLGFVPAAVQDGMLLGVFMVNDVHNYIHLVTGVLILLAVFMPNGFTRLLAVLIGIAYLGLAAVGMLKGGDLIYMQVNMADNILHLVIGVLAFLLGCGCKSPKY